MSDTRKKITAYIHPSVYPQDALTQAFVENLPNQTRGEFYRQSIICGAALSSVDPRLVNLICGLFHSEITAEDLIKIIEQVTGYKSKTVDIDLLDKLISGRIESNATSTEKNENNLVEQKAIHNLSMLKK